MVRRDESTTILKDQNRNYDVRKRGLATKRQEVHEISKVDPERVRYYLLRAICLGSPEILLRRRGDQTSFI
jgi:hypothetical protein